MPKTAQERVLNYECTVYYTSTGSSHTKQYPFTQAQADEVGAVLEMTGLSLETADRLCEKWTKRGKHQSIRYSYRIPLNNKGVPLATHHF